MTGWLRVDPALRAHLLKKQTRLDVVYFIRGGRSVKIGTTDDITKRFEALRGGSPVRLQLLGMVHGGVNVERWCHFHCIDHWSHFEWFKWNSWTQSFVEWVLAHGDSAAEAICRRHFEADQLERAKRPAFAGRLGPLPWTRRGRTKEAVRDYVEMTAEKAVPLGECTCAGCETRPWSLWGNRPAPRETLTT